MKTLASLLSMVSVTKKSAYVATDRVTGAQSSKSGQAHRIEAGYDANNLFVSGGYQYTNGWDSQESYHAA